MGTRRECTVCGATESEVSALGCQCTDLDVAEEDECLAPVLWHEAQLQEGERVRVNGQRTA